MFPQAKIETDRTLVASPCLRVRTRRTDYFVWRSGSRLRFERYERRSDAR